MDFDEEEVENTSDEASGKLLLDAFDDDDDFGSMMMPHSSTYVTDSARDPEKGSKKVVEEKRKRAREPSKKKSKMPEELRDAYNQLVEPTAFDAFYGPHTEKSEKSAKYAARRTTASGIIEQYMQPTVDAILEKIAKNEPFATLVGLIVDGHYDRLAFKNPPKPPKDTKIRDIYTGEIMDEQKSNKEQSYILLRDASSQRYEGYYMAVQGANIIQLITIVRFFYTYLHRTLAESFTDEQRTLVDAATPWADAYSVITHEFSDKPVHKWTKKKGVVEKGSFVDNVIKVKRTLEALSDE